MLLGALVCWPYEIARFFGWLSPAIVRASIYAAFGMIPFLFFQKTRSWKTLVHLFFVFLGYQLGKAFAGRFLFSQRNAGFAYLKPFAVGILVFWFLILSVYPFFLFKVLKSKWWRCISFFGLLIILFLASRAAYVIPLPAGTSWIIRDEETGQVSYVPEQQEVVIDQQLLQILKDRLGRYERYLKSQYDAELGSLKHQLLTDQEFFNSLNQLNAKHQKMLNTGRYKMKQQVQQIRQIQNLINDNKISIQAGNEAMWRIVLPYETEDAMFPMR